MERPTITYGGPSPRMRALASHDKLTRRSWLSSFRRNQPLGVGAGLGGATIARRAGSGRLGFFDFSRHSLVPLAGAPCATLGASRAELPMGKNSLGGLARKVLAGAAPGLIPTGATCLNSLAPAVFEAVNRYMKSTSAGLLEFALRRKRVTGCGLYLFQQVSITIVLRRVLGKSPYDSTELGQVRRAQFRRARFEAYG
jgi:hypothetical protein